MKESQNCDTLIISGLPAAQIINLSEKEKVDLIVMETHGRAGIHHLLIGSVADKVIRTATCPILVVREQKPKQKRPKQKEGKESQNP